MNINQIKYFVSVFEQQSFSLAAKERQVSVQAVSKSINDLEREVGERLLDRSGHGAIPTPLGRRFYQKARLALKAFNELEAFTSHSKTEDEDTLNFHAGLCTPEFTNGDILRKSLSKFVHRNTGFNVDLSLVSPLTAAQDLAEGKFDALITIGNYENDETESVCIGSLPTGVQISLHHPLAQLKSVTLEDLAEYPAGLSPVYDNFNESILRLYQKRGLVGEVRTVESVAEDDRSFMLKDNGYFFSAMFPVGVQTDTNFVLKPIDRKQAICVPICLVSRKGNKAPNHQAIESFLVNTVHLLQRGLY